MAYIICPCGAQLSNVAFPAPHSFRLVSDADLDAVTDYRDIDDVDIIDRDAFDRRSKEALQCFACPRLLIWDGATWVSYLPEDRSGGASARLATQVSQP